MIDIFDEEAAPSNVDERTPDAANRARLDE